MGSHPVNLAARFILELAAFGAFGFWGWTAHTGASRWLWAISLPVLAAAAWGTFAVPNDPSRSGAAPVPVPGVVRLFLELTIFAAAIVLLAQSGPRTLAAVLAGTVVVHYAVSYDRVAWLLS